ncbi:MAG: hypothetical protein IJY39_01650 [Clostridia bacterium]|nr:hypothetical protein [Clostridia bacterium]
MLNYSIMSLNQNHIDEFCDDIEYQVKNGIATMPLFCMTLTPEGDPTIDKADLLCQSYEKYKGKLDSMEFPSGVLIQASIGHGWKLNQPSAFQKYVALTTGISPEVCCPLDKGFQKYIRAATARIASTHPHHIMLDDDFRLIFRDGSGGCACPLHLAEYEKLTGEKLSREELCARIAAGDKECADAFVKTQIDSLTACAREIRAGIDSVDPKIPGSFCACGDGTEGAYDIATIMAGEGNPVVVRINNANYCAYNPRDFAQIMHRAATQIAALGKKPDYILAETDTCPQNRYSTPAAKLHSHFTFTILEGAKGAKHWITRLSSFEPESGVAYRKKLEKYSGFYAKLAEINDDLIWQGCKIPIPPRPAHMLSKNDTIPTAINGWCSHVLDRFGLPMHFSPDGEGVYFFDGAKDKYFTDEELLSILSGKTVLDSTAAKRLVSRGFGEYLGVDVKDRPSDALNASGEIFYPCGSSSAQPRIRELIPRSSDVKVYSDVYHLRDGVHKDIIFPGVTSYKNALGGIAVVFAGESTFAYNLIEAFGFLNQTRKAQLAQILQDLDALPAYYPGDAEVLMKAAEMKDGKLFCAILNMSLDVIEDLPLTVNGRVAEIKKLCPNGDYESVSFTENGNTLTTNVTAGVFDPVILVLTLR